MNEYYWLLILIVLWILGFFMGKSSVKSSKRDMKTFKKAPFWSCSFNIIFLAGIIGIISGQSREPNIIGTILLIILTLAAGGSIAYFIQYLKERQ